LEEVETKMNAKTCMYIDKSKILPALEARRKLLIEAYMCSEDGVHRMDYLQIADEIGQIIENIEMGMFDWNQGSE
jgi:hypothetical protein